MCCACGRRLSQQDFDLEHLIPQQSLREDPAIVRADPSTPKNVRAGNLLLCKAPLKYKGNQIHGSGCNSWKGRHYDRAIRDLTTAKAFGPGSVSQLNIIAGLAVAYLALVSEYGYRVVVTQSGLLMRQQFFNPFKFHPQMPVMSQMILGGSLPITNPNARIWANPFSFKVEDGRCVVACRNFVVHIPLSDDPRIPIARHLRFAPSKYKLRPDLTAVLD